jgi:hypothetical protein
VESIALKIININALVDLEKENEQIPYEKEKVARNLLIEAITDKITDYDAHILEYEYNKYWSHLIDRGIEFLPCEKNFLFTQWDTLFSSLVPEQVKRSTMHYSDQFKWHVFSFDLLKAQHGSHARKAFDMQKKTLLYMFFQYGEQAFHIKNADLLNAEDLDMLSEYSTLDNADIYIFDPLSKWTYVKTHEESCGPYFYYAKCLHSVIEPR